MLTTLTPVVYQGALSPEALTVTVEAGESTLDLTTVSGVSLSVRRPDGEELTWASTVLSSTTTQLVAQHLFASGDTDQLGEHRAILVMTVPGGAVRSLPRPFQVVDKYGVRKAVPGA